VPVLRWSPTKLRKAEALRDRIMRGVGTDEPWVVEEHGVIAVHYRKPLRIDEVARMAPTAEVLARPGRA
jgi:hypothetical protein